MLTAWERHMEEEVSALNLLADDARERFSASGALAEDADWLAFEEASKPWKGPMQLGSEKREWSTVGLRRKPPSIRRCSVPKSAGVPSPFGPPTPSVGSRWWPRKAEAAALAAAEEQAAREAAEAEAAALAAAEEQAAREAAEAEAAALAAAEEQAAREGCRPAEAEAAALAAAEEQAAREAVEAEAAALAAAEEQAAREAAEAAALAAAEEQAAREAAEAEAAALVAAEEQAAREAAEAEAAARGSSEAPAVALNAAPFPTSWTSDLKAEWFDILTEASEWSNLHI